MYILKASTLLFTVMVTLILCGTALAQTSQPPTPEPLVLTEEQGRYPLGLHLELLEDPSGELSIEDVSSPQFDSQFIPSQVEVPNYGFTDSVYWVRLRLENQTDLSEEWLLEQGFANTHFVDLYTPALDSGGFAVKQTGVLRPVATRDVIHPRLIFNLTIPPQSQGTYYLRFQSGASMTLPLTLWAQAAFLDHALIEQTFMGIFFGVLIGLLFYNLFLYLTLRETNYLFFVILLASVIFEDASYSGHLRVYIIPNLDIPVQYIEPVALPLLIGSLVLFSDSFLELKRRHPKLHVFALVILAVWGALMLLIPFTNYRILGTLMAPWSLISLLVVMIAGIASWIGGYRPSRFFMLAWVGLILSLVWVFLVRLGLAPSTLLSENAFRIGYLWMAVCFSIALADRINLLKAETEAANLALRNSENRLSEILEGLPLGVVVYGTDQKPTYINQRAIEILSNPELGIVPDIAAGRSLAQAVNYFSLKVAGTEQEYPLETLSISRALLGEVAATDDIEADLGDRRVPLEIWASPVRDDLGNVQAAVIAFQDITRRKQAEEELAENRKHLESLVKERTGALNAANERLNLHLEWLSALNLVNQTMARTADFAQIYENILGIINDLFNIQGSFIAELEADGEPLKILAHSCRNGYHHELVGTFTTFPESVLSDLNTAKGKFTSLSEDQLSMLSGSIATHLQDANIHRLELVLLRLRDQNLGVMGLEMVDEERVITSEESNLLSIFSTDIAQLIEDSRLFEQSKELIAAGERNRLANELHDSVTQTLFTASVLAEATPRIWDKDQEVARQNMRQLTVLIRGALAEMRSMLIELRSGEIGTQTLAKLLTTLVEAAQGRSRAVYKTSIMEVPELPEKVTQAFYRIAREAFNNIIVHAAATRVEVSLVEERGRVAMHIQDNGRGFDPEAIPVGHLGIRIIDERAAEIGGDLQIQSRPGHGTQITLTWSRPQNGRWDDD